MRIHKESPCKINLLLNILGKRADGFHELETVMHPIALSDALEVERGAEGIQLTCNHPELPLDGRNLVHRAAQAFLSAAQAADGIRVHLEKRVPLAAGLGGGSANAATTLLSLNELFGAPLDMAQLHAIAAGLGSDVPFFLQARPAIATGRGECIQPLEFFKSLEDAAIVLVHPGFGVSTPWAYGNLARFPTALNGTPGRARILVDALLRHDLRGAAGHFYNSLEAPVLEKYPLLVLFQRFFTDQGAIASRMSGSGSSTFALVESLARARQVEEEFRRKFGPSYWARSVSLRPSNTN